MNMLDYPTDIKRLNRLLESELGSNPRYAWRWSEDLLHVMYVVNEEGKPIYEDQIIALPTDKVLYGQVQKTLVRKLLPHHQDQWVGCSLVEVDDKDGSLFGTGCGSWVPISSNASGPAALPPGMTPNDELTWCIVKVIRRERDMPKDYLDSGFMEAQAKRERDRWNRAYDRIRDASTAFYNLPGAKGHVSFPNVSIKPVGSVYDSTIYDSPGDKG